MFFCSTVGQNQIKHAAVQQPRVSSFGRLRYIGRIVQKMGAVSAALLPLSLTAQANVTPAALFSDHAVLLAGAQVPVWGTARPGEKVVVSVVGKTAETITRPDGKWTARLSRLKMGGPYTLTIRGDNTVVINDVLVGETWLASGQSNMDFTVARTEKKYFAGVENEAQELAIANFPQIRVFTVDLQMTGEPQSDVSGHWAVCSPQTVGDMSAVAYFFARELHQTRHVPVGMVVCAWGASTAEAWTSRAALEADKELAPFVQAFDAKRTAYTPDIAQKDRDAQTAWQAEVEKAKASGAKLPRAPKSLDPLRDQHNATVLYNGEIAPVLPFGFRGVLWYQGESNGPSADKYARLMQGLITDWRKANGTELPFLFVQLAAYGKPATDPVGSVRGTVGVRDAQRQTLAVSQTAMASALDLGDETNIHPKRKQEVGKKSGGVWRWPLALWCTAKRKSIAGRCMQV